MPRIGWNYMQWIQFFVIILIYITLLLILAGLILGGMKFQDSMLKFKADINNL